MISAKEFSGLLRVSYNFFSIFEIIVRILFLFVNALLNADTPKSLLP